MPGKKEMIQFEICLLRMAIRDRVYMFLYDVAFKAHILIKTLATQFVEELTILSLMKEKELEVIKFYIQICLIMIIQV